MASYRGKIEETNSTVFYLNSISYSNKKKKLKHRAQDSVASSDDQLTGFFFIFPKNF